MRSASEKGVLYVVATPIGNLEDVTLRALRVLREVDLIVAEDTRRTRRLLAHYQIETPFGPSLYRGVEARRVPGLIRRLQAGQTLALVSDAGTPLVSDPGAALVRACIAAGIEVVPVPGPSALLAALVKAGLNVDRFVFEGTPPKKVAARRAAFAALKDEPRTVVWYESPHRLRATLADLAELLPERRLVLCRELTKRHEEALRGTAAELLRALSARPSIKGECVLVVAGAAAGARRGQAGCEASQEEASGADDLANVQRSGLR